MTIRERVPAGSYALLFTVEGSGQFPVDMLRYDACYPYSEAEDVPGVDTATYGEKRRVVLAARPLLGEKHVSITPRRWDSFNWQVVGLGVCRDTTKYPSWPRGGPEEALHRARDY